MKFSDQLSRKEFIRNSSLLLGTMAMPGWGINKMCQEKDNNIFSLEEIKEFVFAAHKDFDKTKSIVSKKPLIINCTNQPQRGDFETAMGGAAHMGRKDIADLLLQRGAVLDIFSMTFLGYYKLVQELILINPQYLKAPGPHGFTLLHHARVGKHKDFENWLLDRGLEEDFFEDVFK